MPPLLLRLHDTFDDLVTPSRCLIAAALLYVLMLSIGAIPGKAEALSAAVYDKFLHFAAYTVLSGLVYRGLGGRRAVGPVMRAAGTLAVTGALGAMDEALQALLPYRDANWADWNVDMMAALFCVALLIALNALYGTLLARISHRSTGAAIPRTPEQRE